MMNEEKLIIFQKIYDFLLWLYPLINRIPKSHRLVLGKHLEEMGINLLLLSIQANKIRNIARKTVQLQMSNELDKLRILIRFTKDLRFMSVSQYQYASEKMNEIGKILYAWMNSDKNFHFFACNFFKNSLIWIQDLIQINQYVSNHAQEAIILENFFSFSFGFFLTCF